MIKLVDLSPEIVSRVKSEPEGMSINAIARKHGAGWAHVKTIRRDWAGAVDHTPQSAVHAPLEAANPIAEHFDFVIAKAEEQVGIYQGVVDTLRTLRASALEE